MNVMMHTTPLAILGFGFLLGLRHALDIDHLAAVSTILSERRGLGSASLTGALWGLGHTASLFAVALLVIGLHAEISAPVSRFLEFGVAMMLVGLGVNLLLTLRRGGQLHLHAHEHGDAHVHAHPHLHAPHEVHEPTAPHRTVGRKPFFVGMVHGLAGSGALMLAVLATIPTPALAVVYVLVFGIGSIGGMIAMSLLIGVPMAMAAEHFASSERVVRACAAVGSVAVGLMLAWEIGVDAGLLL